MKIEHVLNVFKKKFNIGKQKTFTMKVGQALLYKNLNFLKSDIDEPLRFCVLIFVANAHNCFLFYFLLKFLLFVTKNMHVLRTELIIVSYYRMFCIHTYDNYI